jgi:short subunit dehydrogenase-like uncharacterized protein
MKSLHPSEEIKSIRFYDEFNTSLSGGTFATLFQSLANREMYKSKLGYDPLLKTFDRAKSKNGFNMKNTRYLSYSRESGSWTGPFFMAAVMGNSVRRSNALLNYGRDMTYSECQVYPSFFAGFIDVVNLLLVATVITSPVLREIARHTVVPKPGKHRYCILDNQEYSRCT